MSGCRRAGHITGCIAGHILCAVCLGVFIYTIGINIHLSVHICYAEDLSEQKQRTIIIPHMVLQILTAVIIRI